MGLKSWHCHIYASLRASVSSSFSHNGQGNEGHEGSGAEGDEEEGCHEGHEGCDEGDEEEGCHEGHEGHEGDEEEGCDEGNEGDEGHEEEGCDEGHEGNEGYEEEVREQDCKGQARKGHGAPWEQGEDCRRLDCQGLVQEQVRQDCEQEAERLCQEVPMDPGCPEGSQGLEDYRLLCYQEGNATVRQGEGVLHQLSVSLCMNT